MATPLAVDRVRGSENAEGLGIGREVGDREEGSLVPQLELSWR